MHILTRIRQLFIPIVKVYENEEAFNKRWFKSINGVSSETANHEAWDMLEFENHNYENEGCWECWDCRGCFNCFYCEECCYCEECWECKGCQECNACTELEYCDYCDECNNLKRCNSLSNRSYETDLID